MFKRFALFFCGACTVAALTSCGAGEVGGGVGEFTTVSASAAALTNRLESDVATGNSCSDTGSTGGSVETDAVEVEFTSKAMYSTGALNLVISRITVQYTPVNAGTPDIPDTYLNVSIPVEPGTSSNISVPVLTEAQKIALVNRTTLAMPLCSSTVFEYYVNILFETSEIGGNDEVHNVTAKMNLAVADRI